MSKKRIFNKTIALKLIERGCTLLDLERNKYNKNYQVFIFHNTPKFKEILAQLS